MELKCINKNKDKNGKIVSYILTDKYNSMYEYTGIELKKSMREGRVRVTNLQIDKLGRLIDKSNMEDSKLIEKYEIVKEKIRGNMYITETELNELIPDNYMKNRVLKILAQSEDLEESKTLAIIKYSFKDQEVMVYTISLEGAKLAMKKIQDENQIYIWDLSLRAISKKGNRFLSEMIGVGSLWESGLVW